MNVFSAYYAFPPAFLPSLTAGIQNMWPRYTTILRLTIVRRSQSSSKLQFESLFMLFYLSYLKLLPVYYIVTSYFVLIFFTQQQLIYLDTFLQTKPNQKVPVSKTPNSLFALIWMFNPIIIQYYLNNT